MNRMGFIAACVMASIGLGAASGAQAFKVPEAQGNQHNRLLQRVLSPNPIKALFLTGETFFVTVESDFSAELTGIDKVKAEEQIADKVYKFLKPIIEHESGKPAVFLRPEPRKPADYPSNHGVANVRVYVHSYPVLFKEPHTKMSLDFKIFWIVAGGNLTIDEPMTEISEQEFFMGFYDDDSAPPYQYQCHYMRDCYNDLLTKNLEDGLKRYFKNYYENAAQKN